MSHSYPGVSTIYRTEVVDALFMGPMVVDACSRTSTGFKTTYFEWCSEPPKSMTTYDSSTDSDSDKDELESPRTGITRSLSDWQFQPVVLRPPPSPLTPLSLHSPQSLFSLRIGTSPSSEQSPVVKTLLPIQEDTWHAVGKQIREAYANLVFKSSKQDEADKPAHAGSVAKKVPKHDKDVEAENPVRASSFDFWREICSCCHSRSNEDLSPRRLVPSKVVSHSDCDYMTSWR